MTARSLWESLKNVFIALIFAVGLLLVMVQTEQQTRDIRATFSVQATGGVSVRYLTDSGQPPTFDIKVRGPNSALQRLEDITATLRLPATTELNERSFSLKDFEPQGLPPGVYVDQTNPSDVVKVVLSRLVEDELLIEPDVDRTLPEGWEVVDDVVTVEPRAVRASGPVEEMSRPTPPRLRTPQVSLMKILERERFDASMRSFPILEQVVAVQPPEKSSITLLGARTAKVSAQIRLKPLEYELELNPTLAFPWPGFAGLPFKLVPGIPGRDVVRLKVRGPEIDFKEKALEATKARFTVLAKAPLDLLQRKKGDAKEVYDFSVEVIAPQGFTIVSGPESKTISFRLEPLSQETTPGGP